MVSCMCRRTASAWTSFAARIRRNRSKGARTTCPRRGRASCHYQRVTDAMRARKHDWTGQGAGAQYILYLHQELAYPLGEVVRLVKVLNKFVKRVRLPILRVFGTM
jgi:hypothetical protein